ncbi:antitoxin Xre/MbcA/ParS toxin-binding domain-containing protein [Aeromonas veronii]|uniref:antitoxin Xre/MbcA/ParS toxin-binding domain-containing protein n=2 Tax=Aeromonadaceae TaxID=84642 RepID=UPI0027D9E064|nr:antitoxin Xre/MbcA/ParS toxin-binding domain-containing protein [Aeromonas veronii]
MIRIGLPSTTPRRRRRLIMTHVEQSPTTSNLSVLESLGLPRNWLAAHQHIVSGVSPEIVVKLSSLLGSNTRTICQMIGISRDTLNRQIKRGNRLSTAQGDRVYWAALAVDAAISLHRGDTAKTMRWLTRSAWGLGGEKPADVITTPMGAQAVIDLVGRIRHGISC